MIEERSSARTRGALGLLVLRSDGRILRADETFVGLLGRTTAELKDRALGDFLDRDTDIVGLIASLARAFHENRGAIPARKLALRRAGPKVSSRSLSVEVSVIAGEHDTITLAAAPREDAGRNAARSVAADPSSDFYREIYENVAEGLYRCDLNGALLRANPALARLHGYADEAELLAAVKSGSSQWHVDPDRQRTFRRMLDEKGTVRDFVSEVRRHRSGERIWISQNARLMRDPASGACIGYEGSVRDVTNTVTLLHETAKLDKIAAQAPGCLFEMWLDETGRRHITYASAGLTDLAGITPREMVDDIARFERRVHPEDREGLVKTIVDSAASLTPWRHDFRLRRTDGEDVWIGAHALPETNADGATVWHGFLSDVTEARMIRARMESLAFTDPLTGLPNRQMLRERARHELSASDRTGEWGAVLFIDLDGFKQLNDGQGHDAGDQLLIAIARRLKQSVRQTDMVARLGGDEFVVLLNRLSGDRTEAARDADAIAETLRRRIEQPYRLSFGTFRTSSSIGMELFHGSGIDFDALLRRADAAMYRAKSSGRNRVVRCEAHDTHAAMALPQDREIEEAPLAATG